MLTAVDYIIPACAANGNAVILRTVKSKVKEEGATVTTVFTPDDLTYFEL